MEQPNFQSSAEEGPSIEQLDEGIRELADQEDQNALAALEASATNGLTETEGLEDKSQEKLDAVAEKVNQSIFSLRGAIYAIGIATLSASAGGCSADQANGFLREGGRMLNDSRKFVGESAMATLDDAGVAIEDANQRARYGQYERVVSSFSRNARVQYTFDGKRGRVDKSYSVHSRGRNNLNQK